MAMSEARKRANKKWNDENMRIKYDRIQLVVAKGQKEVLQSIAKEQGASLNGYTKQALKAKIKADTGKDVEL
ncbi:MAG: antitoxin [Eubacteriales bacterium]|nr:antitoxin [Eubacteriales bacterium]